MSRGAPKYPGPGVRAAFTVVSGVVIVVGSRETVNVTLTPGGTWPGVAALPECVRDALEPGDSLMVPGSVWQLNPTDAEVRAGVSAVTSQVLRGLRGQDALDLLVQLDVNPARLNQSTLAAMLGYTRESVNKHLTAWQDRHAALETR